MHRILQDYEVDIDMDAIDIQMCFSTQAQHVSAPMVFEKPRLARPQCICTVAQCDLNWFNIHREGQVVHFQRLYEYLLYQFLRCSFYASPETPPSICTPPFSSWLCCRLRLML